MRFLAAVQSHSVPVGYPNWRSRKLREGQCEGERRSSERESGRPVHYRLAEIGRWRVSRW